MSDFTWQMLNNAGFMSDACQIYVGFMSDEAKFVKT